MNPTPYLTFQGTCREAMETYARIFGGEIETVMVAEEMPGYDVPEGKAGWVAHCGIRFDGGMLLGSDDLMGGSPEMAGASVLMALPTVEAGRTAFGALAEGGTVRMPYDKTFWSPGFGMLRDRFGVNWMITTDAQPDG